MKSMLPTIHIPTTSVGRSVQMARHHWPAVLLGLLAASVLLWELGAWSLANWDEAVYAQVSKEILERGEWLTPHYEYQVWIDKPPLFLWTTAILYELFEVNEFWARAASAFSGIGLVVVVYVIGDLVYDRMVGVFAGLILLTSPQFVKAARFGTTDVMLTLLVMIAIYGYLRLERGSGRWWYLIASASALAVLVKSSAALVGPAAIGVGLAANGRLADSIRSSHFRRALLLAVAICGPWHVWMLMTQGQAFVDNYLKYNTVDYLSTPLDGHVEALAFYISVLQSGLHAWYGLGAFTLALALEESFEGSWRSRILLILIAVVFGLFTLAQTKLFWYVLPLYPSVALITASMMRRAISRQTSFAGAGLAVATIGLVLTTSWSGTLMLWCAGLSVALTYTLRRSTYHLAPVVMSAFCFAVALTSLSPLYRQGDAPQAQLARLARSETAEDRAPLILYPAGAPGPSDNLWRPATLFYSDRPILEAFTLDDLAALTSDGLPKWAILLKERIIGLLGGYDIRVLAESEPYAYATIKRTGMMD